MFNKNKFLLSFLFSACLSSFAPGAEIGCFNKTTQFNKYAYYGVQQFCAYRFASSGIRRMNYVSRQSFYNPVSAYMLSQNRKIVDPVLLYASAFSFGSFVIFGVRSFPLIISGGIGTAIWANQKMEKDKKTCMNEIMDEEATIEKIQAVLNRLETRMPEERKTLLQKSYEKLDSIRNNLIVARLLLEDNRYRELIKLLSNNDKEKEADLLKNRRKQREAISILFQNFENNHLDLSFISNSESNSTDIPYVRLSWPEKRDYVVKSISDQQKKFMEILSDLERLQPEDLLNS